MQSTFKQRLTLFAGILLLGGAQAQANICGTDYQNFNPTTNGLDFVTVQSSETLKPCIVNMGLFLNYAENSLTYSESLNANFTKGQKRQDQIVGADLSLGFGLTEKWDIGFNVPVVLSQTVQDDHYVASFDEAGITEFKVNSKYRLWGDESGGVAAVFSVNQNLIQNNPFSGRDPGPTWNYELAADTVIASNWAVALNLGYRDRNPGSAIPNVPFVPMKDQWIYSLAGSYLFSQYDSKLILEIYGSRPAQSVDQDTDRGLSALEALAGVKHDYNQNTALHFGMTKQMDSSLGGAEWRAYAGVNWAIGPLCNSEVVLSVPGSSAQESQIEIYKLDVELLFGFNVETPDEKALALIDGFLQEILAKGFQKITIAGHTDSVGVPVYNQYLSEKRAQSVRSHLIEKFKISAEKIEAVGFGASQPLADNGNYQGRRANRRVEIKVERTK